MAKKIKAVIKLYCPAGQANPSPPVGPALGQQGLNIMEFCKSFNEKTKGQEGLLLPVVITAYLDRSFSFIIKSPAGAMLLKKSASIARASGQAGREEAGAVTQAEVKEIAKTKIKDLNTTDMEKAAKIIAGTARSMGITIVQTNEEKQKILAAVQEKAIKEEKTKPQPAAKTPAEADKKPQIKAEKDAEKK